LGGRLTGGGGRRIGRDLVASIGVRSDPGDD
jgi:hypothetical protein